MKSIAREPLGARVRSFNTPIQSEAVIEVSESDFDFETSKMASDWIGMFEGPNVCTQRFSRVLPHTHL